LLDVFGNGGQLLLHGGGAAVDARAELGQCPIAIAPFFSWRARSMDSRT
jgi:hypothetical protein